MMIGGLFLLYGVILIVVGVLGSAINLWTGLAMAVFGLGIWWLAVKIVGR